MGADVFIDSRVAANRVRDALRGPVIRVLAEGIPEIRHMSHATAYDILLGDIALLERGFAYFRANRQRFEAILVDGEQRPVNDDAALLACGRTLNEVIAMMVRSAASRHFKKRLGNRPAVRTAVPVKAGLLATLLAPVVGARRSAASRPVRSKAQELYLAIREYLLYEWQVPLVPTYSELTPREVVTLGPRIVDLRSAEAILVATGRPRLKAIPPERSPGLTPVAASTGAAPAVAAPPAVAAIPGGGSAARTAKVALADLLTEDGKRLDVETLAGVLRDPDVVRAGDNGEQPAHVKAALKSVGRDLVRFLVEDLGLDKRQLAVCLVRAQAVMPRSTFDLLVRSPTTSVPISRLAGAATKSGIGPKSTLAECADFISRVYPARQPAVAK